MIKNWIIIFLVCSLMCTMSPFQNDNRSIEEPFTHVIDSVVNENTINHIEIVRELVKDYDCSSCLSHQMKEMIDKKQWWYITCNDDFLLYMKICSRGGEFDLDSFDVFLNYKESFEYKLCRTTEKQIHIGFSKSKPLMIINYLDDRPEHYDASLDDYFWIYNLDSIANGIIHKDSIYCKYCDNGYVIGDRLFFTRSNERDDFQNGFWLTDIYVSPYNDIADSIVIARNFEIRAISNDGKYILAENKNTLSEYSCSIINVEMKKYQVLLGRNYCNRRVIYSDEEQKFGFIFGKKIVYVDMPKTFPFDALEKKNIFWPRPPKGWDKKFETPPLK